MKPRVFLLLAALGLSCSRSESDASLARVVVRAAAGSDVDLESIQWPASVKSVVRVPRGLELAVDRYAQSGPLTLRGPGLCPATVALDAVPSADVEIHPLLIASAGNAVELGFDQPFTITLTPGCREGLAGKVEWTQLEGLPLQTSVEQRGLVLRGRTRPLADVHPGPIPDGIVPLSPRTRGQYLFRARFSGGGATSDVVVRLASAARSSGLPSVALGTRIFLGGSGWHVKTPARNGHAEVEPGTPLESFRPDARGRWLLEDAVGTPLALVAGLHSDTPLDCGRSECHQKETEAARNSPMTSVFQRGLMGAFADYDPACAVGCHTTGEPGLADGGFDAVRRELGYASKLHTGPDGWDALPRALRRIGGVTCTACHGPGAIPEPTARWAVLRADVCAVCHDAPPRYGLVVAWQRTRMARSDADPDARHESACRGCHTTAGFLERQGIRKPDPNAPDVPVGVSCAACHAPHGPSLGPTLLRDVPLPKGISLPPTAGASRVCVSCHASDAGGAVGASAASLVFGSAGGTPPPHAELGCSGCHGAKRVHGEGHDFASSKDVCAPCHEGGIPATPDFSARARTLYAKITGTAPGPRPVHAGPPGPTPPSAALGNVLRVLEDPAAGVHNAAYARALLDEAEASLGKPR